MDNHENSVWTPGVDQGRRMFYPIFDGYNPYGDWEDTLKEEEEKKVFMMSVNEDIEDIGEHVTREFKVAQQDGEGTSESTATNGRSDFLADTGASHNIVNDKVILVNERPARGTIKGSDPNSAPDQITSVGDMYFWGIKCKAFRAPNIPKSVIAVVEMSKRHPLSFTWRAGSCTIRNYNVNEKVTIQPIDNLTKLPSYLFDLEN
jgi:hypothetical protein